MGESMSLLISTTTPESTDDLLKILKPRQTLEQIKKILGNRRPHSEQIKAIKKLLEPKNGESKQ